MHLENAFPKVENFTYLMENTKNKLLESFEFLEEESLDLSQKTLEKFSFIQKSLSKNKKPLFPYLLLNHSLTIEYDTKNNKKFEKLVDNFSLNILDLEEKPTSIPFGHEIFSEQYWEICEKIIVSSFSEPVTLSTPPPITFQNTHTIVSDALREIEHLAPLYYDEIKSFVAAIFVTQSNRFKAGSSFPMMGLIGLSDQFDLKTIVDYIIHETAHQYIYHLTVFDPLCEGEGLYKSPLRTDPRPLEGIYHATFVLARLINFYKNALGKSQKISDSFMEQRIKSYSEKYKEGYALIEQHAKLTPLGKKLMQSTTQLVSN